MLQGVDPGRDRRAGASQQRAVGGDRGAAGVHRLHRLADLAGGEGGGVTVGPVHVQLHQVGAIVELAESGSQQAVPVIDFDRHQALG